MKDDPMSDAMILETAPYLTFRLADETFALDVANVREILESSSITKVPRTPRFMLGVINVRGNVVPVLDMRLKLGLPATKPTVDTCIIVTEINLDGDTVVVGALADAVQEVFELEAGMIEPPPKIGARWNTEFIKGLGKRDEAFIMILDMDKLVSSEETVFAREADMMASSVPAAGESATAA